MDNYSPVAQFSGEIVVDGAANDDAPQNFGALLQAAGYGGTLFLMSYKLKSDSDVPFRFILTDDAENAPDKTKGVSVANDLVEDKSSNLAAIIDAGKTWLYSAEAVTISVILRGSL